MFERLFRSFAPMAEGEGMNASGGSGAPVGGSPIGGVPAGGAPATPITLSDTTPIMGEDGKPTTWGEYSKSRDSRFQTSYKQQVREGLQQIAQRLQQQQPRQPNQQPRQPADPFASVRGKPIVDGDTLAQLAQNGFAPFANAINQLQQQNQQLAAQLKQVTGGFGKMQERDLGQAHESRLDKTLSGLGYDPKDAWVRDVADDVFRSYDWDASKPNEFSEYVKTRVEGAVKFVRAMDKKKLEEAKNRRFVPVRPGGNGNPSGAQKMDQKDYVDNLWKQMNQATGT